MNCKCISDLQDKVRQRVQPQVKAPIESVECGTMGFVIEDNTLRHSLFIPFVIKADAPRYRGKGHSMNVYVSYCPFCGKPARAEQKAA